MKLKLKLIISATLLFCSSCSSNPKGEREMSKKALIVITSHDQLGDTGKKTGWYLSEVTHVYYPLIEAGFKVNFASPKGGNAPLDESSKKLNDPYNKKFLEDDTILKAIKNTLKLSEVDPSFYQVIHFAGGHGTMWDFANDKDIARIAGSIYDNGGIVAAICHGPAALVNVKLANGNYLVKDKTINSFTNAEEAAVELTNVVPFLLESKLKERGAKFQAGAKWEDKVVVSERLVTGQNPQSGHTLGKKIVELSKAIGQ